MKSIDKSELHIIFKEIANKNEKAYTDFYNKYNKLVHSIAFSILKNKEDSEEIVQAVFLKIYKLDKDKLPTSNEASWLYSLTKNETISFLRKKNTDIDLDSIYEIEDRNNEINKIVDQESYNNLISKLDNKEKQIISLKILGEFSFDEISKLLSEPVGTIKWRYYKGVHTLKLLLNNLGMFIVTFVIGLKALLKQNDVGQELINNEQTETNQENTKNEQTETNKETTKGETLKSENDATHEPLKDITVDNNSAEEDIKQEVIIQDNTEENNINFLGVWFISVSCIFLILTIIFTIFLVKYQLKGRKKSSK